MKHILSPINAREEKVSKYIKLRMTIEDNGVGISKDNQSKLFQDFTRLNEHTSLNFQGTGLGLSICKNIIEQMGGNVSVESEEGKGTKFHIIIGLKVQDILKPM